MNPFLLALVQAGIITQADAERMNRTLDPDAARVWAEQQLAIAMQAGLSDQQQRLVDLLRRSDGTLSEATLAGFWRSEDERLYAIVRPTLERIVSERAIGIVVTAGGDAAMWQHVNQAALDWMHAYYTSANPDFVGSVPNLNQTSRQQFAEIYGRWARGELDNNRGLPTLIQELQQTFGPGRAEIIGVTETTRIRAEAEHAAALADPDLEFERFKTAVDDRVCGYCGPLHNQTVRKGEPFIHPTLGAIDGPPVHPRCRCAINSLTGPAARQPIAPEDRYTYEGELPQRRVTP